MTTEFKIHFCIKKSLRCWFLQALLKLELLKSYLGVQQSVSTCLWIAITWHSKLWCHLLGKCWGEVCPEISVQLRKWNVAPEWETVLSSVRLSSVGTRDRGYHRIAEVGRDSGGHLEWPPSTSNWLTRARQMLGISNKGDSTSSLGDLCQSCYTVKKKSFSMFRQHLLCLHLCPLPLVLSLCPFTVLQPPFWYL